MEIWKPVRGWEALYEVSDAGRIRSFDRRCATAHGGVAIRKGRVLSPVVKGKGYLAVTLADRAARKQVLVHSVVLLTFVGVRPEGLQACHFDDDKTNNRLSNLRYDTPEANNADALRNGVKPIRQRHGCAKLTEADVSAIRSSMVSNADISAAFGIHKAHAWSLRVQRHWKD